MDIKIIKENIKYYKGMSMNNRYNIYCMDNRYDIYCISVSELVEDKVIRCNGECEKCKWDRLDKRRYLLKLFM